MNEKEWLEALASMDNPAMSAIGEKLVSDLVQIKKRAEAAKDAGRREAIEEVVEMLERRSTEGYWANLLAKSAIINWIKDFAEPSLGTSKTPEVKS